MAEREGGVMSKSKFPYLEKYDEDNQRLFFENAKGKAFHCVNCGSEVSLDESFSNQGKNMICIVCHMKKAYELGMSTIEYLSKEIWGYKY